MNAAREFGLSPVAVDYNRDPAGKAHCDLYLQLSYRDEERIFDACRHLHTAGIGTIGTNDAIVTASGLNQRLRLPGLYDDPEVIRRATYKHLWRKVLVHEGISTPPGGPCEGVGDLEGLASDIGFPILVKPADASGARGIRIVEQQDQLASAFRHAARYATGQTVVAERYLGHNSFAVESFVVDGEVRQVAVGERKLPPPPLCVGLGITVPDQLPERVRTEVGSLNRRAIEALGISYGPVHVDMVVDSNGRPHVIDIGPRLVGGPFGWKLIREATGFDMVEAALKQAVGKKLRSVTVRWPDRAFAHRYLTTSKRGVLRKVDLKEHLFEEHDITACQIFVKPGDTIGALENSEQRYGFVTARADTFESVCEKIDAFVNQVIFEVE